MPENTSRHALIAREMIEALTKPFLYRVWSKETAAPGCQAEWHTRHPSYGQCGVTALGVNDRLGGEILRCEVPGHGSHYWNRLADGTELDLTREQFPTGTVIPAGVVVPRERLLEGERAVAARTQERYDLFVARFMELDAALDAYMSKQLGFTIDLNIL